MVFSTARFARVFYEKRLELKSFKRQTQTEDLEDPVPEFLSLRLSLKAFLVRAVFEEKLAQNGGTEGALRADGPSLKNIF